ncbi:hypothetical protein [Spirosoma arcticum]
MNAIQLNRSAAKASLLIALTLLMNACIFDKLKKDKDPEPELAGTYQVTRLVDESQNLDVTLPNSGISASVIVTRSSDTEIRFRIDVTVNGRVTTGDTGPATIRKASGRDYDILDGSTRVGSINGTDFSLDFTDGGDRFAITANK